MTTVCVYLTALASIKVLQTQAEDQQDRANALVMQLDNIEAKLEDLKNISRHSIDNAQASTDLNYRNTMNIDSITVRLSWKLTALV